MKLRTAAKTIAKTLAPAWLKKTVRRWTNRHQMDEGAIVHLLFSKRGKRNGVMIDVGAHHGTSLLAFVDLGFRVFAFEPDPNNRAHLQKRAGTLPGVSIDARAVSDQESEDVAFFTSDISTGISGLSSFHKSHVETTRVRTVRLDTYCAETGIERIDFLKIDTEGYDLPVLRSLDWGSLSPEVVLCEFEDRKTVPLGYTYRDLVRFLKDKGYQVLISEWYPIVEYGRRHQFKQLSIDPDSVSDPAAWGNLIAVKPAYFADLLRCAKRLCPPSARGRSVGL